jgi:pyruvate dehydrogenase E1 component alpha subunit
MKFTKKDYLTLYTNLVRARKYDQLFVKRISEGKLIGFYHTSEGGEAPGVGACSFLRKDDYLWPHLRGHGAPHMLSKGIELKYYLAEHAGKTTGLCAGMSSFHFCAPEFGVLGWSGSIGSSFPISLGWGIAAKKNGRQQVVVSCFGDGAAGRGTFHESAIMASNWKLPIVWVCENNKLSMFVSFEEAHPTEDMADLAHGWGMPGVVVDGQDVVAVAQAVNQAVERARQGEGPSLIECKTERYQAHSIGLPDHVGAKTRTKEEIEALKDREPLKICREMLTKKRILTQKLIAQIDRDADAEMAEAIRFVDESPDATDPECLVPALFAE